MEAPVLTGEANEELFSKAMALAKKNNLTVEFNPRPELSPAVKGMLAGTLIWVKPDEPRAQQLKTLLHELGHFYTERVLMIPRADAETIAESTAFVVGAHFGFDTGTRSFPYVAVWSKDKKVLEGNLAAIRDVSTRMIAGIEGVEGEASYLKEIPAGNYVRVTYLESDKRKTLWAKKDIESEKFNLYIPVDKEGGDLSKETKGGYELPKILIGKRLIIKEEPAHIDRTYGEIRVGELPPPPDYLTESLKPTIRIVPYTPNDPLPPNVKDYDIQALTPDGNVAGRLLYEEHMDFVRVGYIQVEDCYQGQGYSGKLLEKLIEVAGKRPIRTGQLNRASWKLLLHAQQAGKIKLSEPEASGSMTDFQIAR